MNNVTIPGKTDMTEVDLIIHILSNLPEEYEVVVSQIKKSSKLLLLHYNLKMFIPTLTVDSSVFKRMKKKQVPKKGYLLPLLRPSLSLMRLL
jgi:hypothetical protein